MKYNLEKSYNPLRRIAKWDKETSTVIQNRLNQEIGDESNYFFLSDRESEILELLIGSLIPQNTGESNEVKISEAIDRNLAKNIQGVRFGKNLWPKEFYRKGLAEIEKFAKDNFEKPIEDFSGSQLQKLIEKIFSLESGDLLHQFLRKVLSDATVIYFSHPASWNQIGFPGPAFPEGYPFLDCMEKEDWEPKYEK